MKLYFSLLSVEQMLDFVSCRPVIGAPRPVVDFTNLDLFNHGESVITLSVPRESLCSRQTLSSTLVFPEQRPFDESARLCHASGGRLSLPRNDEENIRYVELTTEYQDECTGDFTDTVWLGLLADLETETWVHYLTRQPALYQ